MSRIIIALLVLFLAPAALASQQGVVAIRNWKLMDQCAKQAHDAYPDFTAEADAKRDAKLEECLESKNLPPRAPLSPGH